MTTTLRLTFLCCILFLFTFTNAQLVETSSLQCVQLLGLKKLNAGVLAVSTNTSKKELEFTKVGLNGNIVWNSAIRVPDLSGYNFNKMTIKEGENFLYIICQLPKETQISKIQEESGVVVFANKSINPEESGLISRWYVANDKLCKVSAENEDVVSYSIESQDKVFLGKMPEKYSASHHQINFTSQTDVYTSSYKLERNHGEMHLYLAKYDTEADTISEKEYDLTLDNTSYTYNSSFDNRVFTISNGETGFYLSGKLDYQFKKSYPTVKKGDNFIGFWVAKFNHNLELEYFVELPFQYFKGIIPADVIQKPAILDFKEDVNKGLLININELQGVIYGNKYIIYLDSMGIYRYATGGLDAYNILEYDKMGLRNAGRKLRLRMMNDDWPAYATNPFLYLGQRTLDYSVPFNNTIELVNKNSISRENKAYNFLQFKEETLYFEYTNKKKGTLKVYK